MSKNFSIGNNCRRIGFWGGVEVGWRPMGVGWVFHIYYYARVRVEFVAKCRSADYFSVSETFFEILEKNFLFFKIE